MPMWDELPKADGIFASRWRQVRLFVSKRFASSLSFPSNHIAVSAYFKISKVIWFFFLKKTIKHAIYAAINFVYEKVRERPKCWPMTAIWRIDTWSFLWKWLCKFESPIFLAKNLAIFCLTVGSGPI